MFSERKAYLNVGAVPEVFLGAAADLARAVLALAPRVTFIVCIRHFKTTRSQDILSTVTPL